MGEPLISQPLISQRIINSNNFVFLGNLRFEYEFEIKYECQFSIPVCRHYIFTSHNNLIPGVTFSTGKQHEGVRALVLVVRSKGR